MSGAINPVNSNNAQPASSRSFDLKPEIKGKEIQNELSKGNVSGLTQMIGQYAKYGLKVSLSEEKANISGTELNYWKATASDSDGNIYTTSDTSTYIFDNTMSKMLDSILKERETGILSKYNSKHKKTETQNLAAKTAPSQEPLDAQTRNYVIRVASGSTPIQANAALSQLNQQGIEDITE